MSGFGMDAVVARGGSFQRDVPYLPTDEQVALAMLRFARTSPSDVVYDLGCGDGRIVCTAVRQFGASGVGVDIDPQRIRECGETQWHLRPEDRKFARFVLGSFFEVDLTEATVVMLYLLPKINVKLRPKLLWELRPGSRIVANTFNLGDWEPDETMEAHHRTLYKWIVPAWVQGQWRCVVEAPAALGGRQKMGLELERRFQMLSGRIWVGGRSMAIEGGRIRGHEVRFGVPEVILGRGAVFRATLEAGQLRGVWEVAGEAAGPWAGMRLSGDF